MVRPMDNAALLRPFVFAVKRYFVAFFQAFNLIGKVDIVCHQKRLSAGELQDKALVARAFVVIRQGFPYRALTLNLNIALFVFKRLFQNRFCRLFVRTGLLLSRIGVFSARIVLFLNGFYFLLILRL